MASMFEEEKDEKSLDQTSEALLEMFDPIFIIFEFGSGTMEYTEEGKRNYSDKALALLHRKIPLIFYEKYLGTLTKGFFQEDGPDRRKAYPLRIIYSADIYQQRFFDLLFCGSFIALKKVLNMDLIKAEKIPYAFLCEKEFLPQLQKQFETLRKEIVSTKRRDENAPWLFDCAELYGKEPFLKWIDRHIEKTKALFAKELAHKERPFDAPAPINFGFSFVDEDEELGGVTRPTSSLSDKNRGFLPGYG
ncbi:MAG: hypothetical protein PHS57_01465 [Alphaproteobacteria bacterium]|nr:hypothetical protein [Alphaproteobacteria bacterium]